MSGLAKNVGQMGRGVGQMGAGLFRIAQVATVALVGAGVTSAKVSMDMEDQFAAVRKTVEDTPESLDAIKKGLQDISTQIPVTFRDLSTIASEAGALGVATKDIESFTEAVARTSAATVGLDPAMASEAFGKLSTIFTLTGDHIDKLTGKAVSDYDRLGSALVALGNAGASSEAEIVDITKYFAQAGQQAGLSAAQVLGWGSALTSLGMEPEAGGGALQRVFQRITTFLGTGNKKAQEWAKLAGMSTKEFKRAFDEDASGAIIRFISGLKELDKFQGAAALKRAGIVNQRDVRAILALSNHIPVLTYQLGISTDAWAENTALMEVSEKRFDTFKAHLTELHNTVLLGADAIGQGMNPALDDLAEKAKAFLLLHMDDFRDLGKDIGAAIESIDWGKVNQGLTTAVDLGKTLLFFVSKIPVEILAAGAAFSVLNRLSGGLLGAGAGNIIGGALGMVGTLARGALLSALPPALRGPLGAATALHVWVDNMPGAGFMGAGGTTVAGGGGGMGTLLKFVGALGLATVALDLWANHLVPLNQDIADMTTSIETGVTNGLKTNSREALLIQQRGLTEGLNSLFNTTAGLGPLQDVLYGSQFKMMREQIAAIQAELASRGPNWKPPVAPQFGGKPPDERRSAQIYGPPAPGFLEGILERGRAAGYTPKGGIEGAAVQATYQRDMIRQAQENAAKLEAVKTAEQATTAAVNRSTDALAGLRASQGLTALISIIVPPARAFQQVINETRHYGPSVPNLPRRSGEPQVL